jgi:L-iditol 2-dehydrogenase
MSMLAAVYHGPQDLRVEEVPVPEIGAGELLLKVRSASICGTDLRIYHGNHRMYPAGTVRIPGHEVVGEIAAVGAGLSGFITGQRIFVAPNMGCGHCRQCINGNNNRCANYAAIGVTIDGGFAQYMRVPAAAVQQGNIFPISAEVDPAVAALIEPFACVLRGQTVLDIHPGDVVLIIGAGPIGIMHAKLAHLSGAARIIIADNSSDRAQIAMRMGADRVINTGDAAADLPALVAEETSGEGADVVIVAAPSHAAVESALQYAAIGGRINFFAGLPKTRPMVNIDSNLVHYKELTITATTACSTYDCQRAAQIVNSGRIDLSDLVSQRFELAQAVAAFAAAEDRRYLKVVLEP